jgi:hypothetical protein
MNAFELGVAWAGLIMLYDFTMWTGAIFERIYFVLLALPKWIGKPLGLCKVCCCFWLGIPFCWAVGHSNEYILFLGISQAIIIPYHILILILKK